MSSVYVLLLSILLAAIIAPRYIKWLGVKQFGQYIREEGPQAHLKKVGTPTMGAVIFIVPALILTPINVNLSNNVSFLLCLLIGFSIIGFIDDISKVFKKQNEGLTSKQKLAFQIIISIVSYYLFLHNSIDTNLWLPLINKEIDLGFLYVLFCIFMIVGASNATNLTDGLDGLLATTYIIPLSAYAFISHQIGNYEAMLFAFVVMGGLLTFLFFNFNPAKVFMGDTGSLALGALLAGYAIITKTEILLILFGFVFVWETLSVILQVYFFKKYKRRIFKMTPIHHHYELKGFSEKQIVFYFTVLQVIFTIIGLILFKTHL